ALERLRPWLHPAAALLLVASADRAPADQWSDGVVRGRDLPCLVHLLTGRPRGRAASLWQRFILARLYDRLRALERAAGHADRLADDLADLAAAAGTLR